MSTGVAAVLAALSGYWERNNRNPEPAKTTGLRRYRQAAAAAGREPLKIRLP
ncbi:hypothetical protein [Embleya sp. MST-111070]|uniref:hypothetical protein n=1 Tax=Embleya sp. MST-111070 TaxID=3398231 RepID=UPI003F73E580